MRYPEIDFARGVAVILMLIFHYFFDAHYFGKINLYGMFWYFFPRFIGGMFIFISGFTLSVVKPNVDRLAKKVIKLSLLALLITAVTYIFVPEEFVVFGILHFFSAATLLGYVFLKRVKLCLPVGVLIFASGIYLQNIRVETEYLVWAGVMPHGFRTLDYYPLLPWFGVFLLGMYFGNYFKSTKYNSLFENPVSKLGQKSLQIYMLQHPVIILILQIIYGDIIINLT